MHFYKLRISFPRNHSKSLCPIAATVYQVDSFTAVRVARHIVVSVHLHGTDTRYICSRPLFLSKNHSLEFSVYFNALLATWITKLHSRYVLKLNYLFLRLNWRRQPTNFTRESDVEGIEISTTHWAQTVLSLGGSPDAACASDETKMVRAPESSRRHSWWSFC